MEGVFSDRIKFIKHNHPKLFHAIMDKLVNETPLSFEENKLLKSIIKKVN